MKKALATLLCLVMTFGILSACTSSNGNTGNTKPTEEPSNKPEVVTTTEQPTEAPDQTTPTQEPTQEPTESVPEGDVIIPLYSSSQASAVERADPSEFFNYDNFEMWLSPVTPSGRTLGPDGPRLDTIGVGTTFPLTLDPLDGIEGTRDVDIYFYYVQENENSVKELHLYGEVGGEPLAYVLDDVIPLWYNMTKQCLIGYVRISNGDSISYELHEIYYSEPTNMFSVFPYTGDTSVLYNFY